METGTCPAFREVQTRTPQPGREQRKLSGVSLSQSSQAACGTDREARCHLPPVFIMSRWCSATGRKHRALAGRLVMGEAEQLWGEGAWGAPPSTLAQNLKLLLKISPI